MKRKPFIFLCSLLFGLSVSSCENDDLSGGISNLFKKAIIDIGAVETAMQQDSVASIQAIFNADSTFDSERFAKLYIQKSPQWLDKMGLSENGQELVRQIKLSNTEGLDPRDYQLGTIDSMSARLEGLTTNDLKYLEYLLSKSFLDFSKDLLLGKVKPLSIDENWQNVNDTIYTVDTLIAGLNFAPMVELLEEIRPAHPWYKKFRQTALRLHSLNKFKIDAEELPGQLNLGDSSRKIQGLRVILAKVVDSNLDRNSLLWDDNAVQALSTYQSEFGLSTTGQFDSATIASLTQETSETVKQLGLNMERIRWLTKDFMDEFIWVNIPQMEVNYYENDSLTFQMRAVVGRLSRKTPTLDSKLSNIVFNPPWFVPPTILKQEVLPGIQRRGGSYLARRGLVARDRRGRKINPARINAKNYRRYSISQNPGRNSALGSVKFNFPNKEAIFLHDTNHRGDFGRKYRAFSSGCIRVHHPKDFAQFILRDTTYNEAGIKQVIKDRQTKSVKVKRDIGVHIVYLTNAVDSAGNVVKVKDVYKWDRKLAARL